MHSHTLENYRHHHAYGTDEAQHGERRTWWVIVLTAVMMVLEIAGGMAFGSMALLADGWHMGTHAAALSITIFAYVFARRHARDPRYTFGTGKVGALGGFASAVALGVVALVVFGESAVRMATPVLIRFNEAIAVAIVGLLVNVASALILHDEHHHAHPDHHHGHHHDHNLRGAYLHVMADALTSLLAIAALVVGKVLGWVWLDPAMGVVGSLVIARWSWGLLRDTGRVLLDAEVSAERRESVRRAIESDGDSRVADLHLWRVGPRHLASIVSVVSHEPKAPDDYKALLEHEHDLVHVTVEVNRCPAE